MNCIRLVNLLTITSVLFCLACPPPTNETTPIKPEGLAGAQPSSPTAPLPATSKELSGNATTPKAAPGKDTVLARINDVSLTQHDLQRAIIHQAKAMAIPPERFDENVKQALSGVSFEQMIVRELLRQEAERQKIEPDKVKFEDAKKMFLNSLPPNITFEQALKTMRTSSQEFHDELRANLIIAAFLETKENSLPAVTEEDARTFFEQNKERFSESKTMSARHLLVALNPASPIETAKKAQEKADELYQLLKNASEDEFAQAAQKHSDDSATKQRGGDLGTFTPEQKLPQFSQAAFSLSKGKVSKPIRTDKGFHLIFSRGISSEKQKQFGEVKEKVMAILANERRAQMTSELIATLRSKNKIELVTPPMAKESLQKTIPSPPMGGIPGAQSGGGHMAIPLPSKDNVLPGIANPHQRTSGEKSLKIGRDEQPALKLPSKPNSPAQ